MKSTFSEEQKARLRSIINDPLFQKAVSEALGAIWRSQSGAIGQEASALAFSYYRGSCEVLTAIHMMADEEKPQPPRPARLNHRA
jgi:hypothetical protein